MLTENLGMPAEIADSESSGHCRCQHQGACESERAESRARQAALIARSAA